MQLSDLVQWTQDILYSTHLDIADNSGGSGISIIDHKTEERSKSIAADGKNGSGDVRNNKTSCKDVTQQVDGLVNELHQSRSEGKRNADDDKSASIPYRIEYTEQVQSSIPNIIIHYNVHKEL